MENHEIIEYIRAQLAAGQTEPAIRQHMIENGWSEQAVGNVFTQYHISTMAVAQPIPITPKPRDWLTWIVVSVVFVVVCLLVFLVLHATKGSKPQTKQSAATSVLQQKANDTARKNDVSRIMTGMAEYMSNNTGVLPQRSAAGDTPSTLLLCGSSCSATVVSSIPLAYYKPANVSIQPYEAGLTVPNDQDVYIVAGVSCAASGDGIGFPDSPRSFVVLYSLSTSSGTTQRCISS